MKFRKKPIDVEAWRYVAPGEIVFKWEKDAASLQDLGVRVEPTGYWGDDDRDQDKWDLYLRTIHDDPDGVPNQTISVGDWVIQEQDGSGWYPCKESVFLDTYDWARP